MCYEFSTSYQLLATNYSIKVSVNKHKYFKIVMNEYPFFLLNLYICV